MLPPARTCAPSPQRPCSALSQAARCAPSSPQMHRSLPTRATARCCRRCCTRVRAGGCATPQLWSTCSSRRCRHARPRCRRCSCSAWSRSRRCTCPVTPPSTPASRRRACSAGRNSPRWSTPCCGAGCANARRCSPGSTPMPSPGPRIRAGCSTRSLPTGPAWIAQSPTPTTWKRRCGCASTGGAPAATRLHGAWARPASTPRRRPDCPTPWCSPRAPT
jgi:hypothetical protein